MSRVFLVLQTAVICLLPACTPSIQSFDSSVGEDLMRRAFDVWISKDLSQLDLIFAEDAVFVDVAEGASYEGLAAIKAGLTDDFSAVPDVTVEIHSTFATEDRGALEWTWSGTQTEDYPGLIPATGKHFSVRGVSVFEFREGKKKRQLDYYDAAGFLKQLGVEFVFPGG
jgi:steroid delta-isomerase-like uncharacterized protein